MTFLWNEPAALRKDSAMKDVSIWSLVVLAMACCAWAAGCSSTESNSTTPAATESAASSASIDPRINAILETSCYSCHSTGGTTPWYAAVSPTYLASNSARHVLNFSDWQTYDAEKKAAELKSIAKSVSSGSMPPGDYTVLDHSARLSDADKQALLNWASQSTRP